MTGVQISQLKDASFCMVRPLKSLSKAADDDDVHLNSKSISNLSFNDNFMNEIL